MAIARAFAAVLAFALVAAVGCSAQPGPTAVAEPAPAVVAVAVPAPAVTTDPPAPAAALSALEASILQCSTEAADAVAAAESYLDALPGRLESMKDELRDARRAERQARQPVTDASVARRTHMNAHGDDYRDHPDFAEIDEALKEAARIHLALQGEADRIDSERRHIDGLGEWAEFALGLSDALRCWHAIAPTACAGESALTTSASAAFGIDHQGTAKQAVDNFAAYYACYTEAPRASFIGTES